MHVLFQMIVEFDRFFDADIEDKDDAFLIMDHYEWAITDNNLHEKTLTKWTKIIDSEDNERSVSTWYL